MKRDVCNYLPPEITRDFVVKPQSTAVAVLDRPSIDDYRATLESAGVNPEDINVSIERLSSSSNVAESSNIAEIRLSRKADRLVNDAKKCGIDPTEYLLAAAKEASERGRKKITVKRDGEHNPGMLDLASQIRTKEEDIYVADKCKHAKRKKKLFFFF